MSEKNCKSECLQSDKLCSASTRPVVDMSSKYSAGSLEISNRCELALRNEMVNFSASWWEEGCMWLWYFKCLGFRPGIHVWWGSSERLSKWDGGGRWPFSMQELHWLQLRFSFPPTWNPVHGLNKEQSSPQTTNVLSKQLLHLGPLFHLHVTLRSSTEPGCCGFCFISGQSSARSYVIKHVVTLLQDKHSCKCYNVVKTPRT